MRHLLIEKSFTKLHNLRRQAGGCEGHETLNLEFLEMPVTKYRQTVRNVQGQRRNNWPGERKKLKHIKRMFAAS